MVHSAVAGCICSRQPGPEITGDACNRRNARTHDRQAIVGSDHHVAQHADCPRAVETPHIAADDRPVIPLGTALCRPRPSEDTRPSDQSVAIGRRYWVGRMDVRRRPLWVDIEWPPYYLCYLVSILVGYVPSPVDYTSPLDFSVPQFPSHAGPRRRGRRGRSPNSRIMALPICGDAGIISAHGGLRARFLRRPCISHDYGTGFAARQVCPGRLCHAGLPGGLRS